jgi:tRNA pseudouridine55 synthase
MVQGVINVNKEVGLTSFAVIARLRHILRISQAGHGGTLDPLASGVLPVFIGSATRLAEYLLEHHKTYRARIELGATTTTYDSEGSVVLRRDASGVTREAVGEALASFRGSIWQKPPLYSAIKKDGQPLYKTARAGGSVELEARPVEIYALEIISFQPPHLELEVECGRGTYIRSLAFDLGERLGCGAFLAGLVRTAYGPFTLENAVTLSELERLAPEGGWQAKVQPADIILSDWAQIRLDPGQAGRVMCGQSLELNQPAEAVRLRACDQDGVLLALLFYDAGSALWKPRKVFKNARQS